MRRQTSAERAIEAGILRGLQEAVAYARGAPAPGTVVREIPITARNATASAPPVVSGKVVARIRKRMKLSQPVFARALNVSPETVRKWEQGKFVPDGSSQRLLQIASTRPEILLAFVSAKPRRRQATAK